MAKLRLVYPKRAVDPWQVKVSAHPVATVPHAAANEGGLIHVSDGSAGSPCVAIAIGGQWLVVAATGAEISSS
jgi:hypothetical protein